MKKVESVWADITAKNEAYKQKFSKQEKVDLSEARELADINSKMAQTKSKMVKLEAKARKLVDENNSIVKQLEDVSSEARELMDNYNKLALKGERARKDFAVKAEELEMSPNKNIDYQGIENRLEDFKKDTDYLMGFAVSRGLGQTINR